MLAIVSAMDGGMTFTSPSSTTLSTSSGSTESALLYPDTSTDASRSRRGPKRAPLR
ncbi:uncharacterized protein SOCE836_097280 [Sorangium cellulosum]|uniref:Uncharacterized protein n=1 Tax=Sorangium cellulosum TaxID=56 RepID=A0A4P2R647_SORCE|nr:uncharacterized protein SOCE836_097280 [Sorangium cellulosum]WCQ96794.1 hypothetical protein NQZ70_09581 [Sorangium sp. Soce836]